MRNILEEIISYKRQEIEEQKKIFSPDLLENNIQESQPQRSMKQVLKQSSSGIIAEFKRKSPSKGWIKENANVEKIALDYEKNGASALSVLTDEKYFGGTLKDIREIRHSINVPILRKEFIVDVYQLYQSKIVGADAILLIAAALSPTECKSLASMAHKLNMEVLLEIHKEKELDHVNDYIDMIGVNNRNLETFHTDIDNSFRIVEQVPKEFLLVSESGISSPTMIKQLREVGFRGFLIGESFMKSESPGNTLKDFIQNIIES